MLRKGYPVTNVYLFKNKLWVKEFSTRMHQWLKGNKKSPIKIDAELHRRCNLDCIFCTRQESRNDMTHESKQIEVDKKRWLEIVEQSGKMGVMCWNISGIGEPMCKPDLTLSVMKKIKEHNIFGEITTNGTLWTEPMVKETIEMGWDSVCISLDSPEKETHNFLRGNKAFKNAVKTISYFKKYKNKLNSDKPTITINVVLNNKNYNQLEELFLLGFDLNVDSIFVEPMIVYTDEANSLKLNRNQINDFETIAKKCEKLGKMLNIEPNINCFNEDMEYQGEIIENTSNMKKVIDADLEKNIEDYKDPDKKYETLTEKVLDIPCYYPWFYMIITADGSTSPCGERINKNENIKNKDLSDIWYGSDFDKDRNFFLNGKIPEYCDRCRPNVLGDMRRIRKSIIELRDKNYLTDAISEVKFVNGELEEKLTLLKKFNDIPPGCNESCNHKSELEELKSSLPYKILSKVTSNKLGKSFKRKYDSKHKNSSSYHEKNVGELRNILLDQIEKNKRLKDLIYDQFGQNSLNFNPDNICRYKKEIEEIKNSLSYKLKKNIN